MALLEVNNLKKIYTTRFGGNQVEALKSMNFSVEEGGRSPFEREKYCDAP